LETDSIPSFCAIIWNIQFHPFTAGIGISVLILLILVILSVFLSASEIASFSISPFDKHLSDNHAQVKNKFFHQNIASPEKLLATIMVANNFIKVCIVLLSAFTVNNLVDTSAMPVLALIVQVILIWAFIMIFCEMFPKMFSIQLTIKFALFFAFPLYCLNRILQPLNSLFIYPNSLINNRIRTNIQHISADELSQALELTSPNEHREEKEILKGIVKFGNKNVAEIMRSRVDVISADFNENYTQILNLISETGFSRIPVYSESIDQIKGILYSKDLFPHVQKGTDFEWQSILRPPFYVPETKKIDVLLEEFQKNKVHMAIVVDEYGGTSGIVTLEDVLEEIVGEITDELDEEEKYYTKISENIYLFDGKTMLSDFYKVTGTDDTAFDVVKGEADTIAGLILEIKGEIPLKNDTINYSNFVFTIEAVDTRRIKQIKVEIKTIIE
jgi:gliding motility-associated protein GldE